MTVDDSAVGSQPAEGSMVGTGVHQLNGPRLARAIRAGALAVARHQEALNRINVFPVPDADTGTNLAATLRAAAASCNGQPPVSVSAAARAAADAALDNARGSSGAIFAQFLHGLADAVHDRVHVSTEEFAAAVAHAAAAAQRALQTPREGTILSVLRAWASAAQEHAPRVNDFAELLKRAQVSAREALAATQRQLEVLRKHGVVDAGAQGFVYFLEGISTLLHDRHAADWNGEGLTLELDSTSVAAHAELETAFRYCSEGLLTGTGLDPEVVGHDVADLGDSLVVAGGGSRLRVHLHTNLPQRFFTLLAAHGTLEHTKVDDMLLQQVGIRTSPVALVVDSTCDLPERERLALAAVSVPLTVNFGDESFLDGVELTPAQFYQRLASRAALPTTSQPSPGRFRATYEDLLQRYEGIVSLHLPARHSGTYQAALRAATDVDPERICVVDTGHISIAQGLVAEAVGEALAAGADLDEAAAVAREVAGTVRVFLALPSLDHIVRGGRMRPGVARVAEMMGLNPILTFKADHSIGLAGFTFGFNRALRAMARRAAHLAKGSPARVMVAHANAAGPASRIVDELERRLGVADIPVVNTGAALGSHAGPGAVAVAIRPLPADNEAHPTRPAPIR